MGRRDVGGWPLWWDERWAEAARASGVWLDRTVADISAERVAESPHRPLIIEQGQILTRADVHARASRLARALTARGLVPGDTISFQLPNWHEAVVIGLAAAMAGLVLNPITPIYRDHELSFMLADSRSKLIFVPAAYRGRDHVAMVRRAIASFANPPEIIVTRGTGDGLASYDQLLAEAPDDRDLPGSDPDAVKIILYTSGTTGRAKGVLHTHNSLQAENVVRMRHLGIGEDDVLFNPSPVTHVTGALYALCLPFTAGITTILMDAWDPEEALALMRRHRATGMIASTIFLTELLAAARAQDEHLPHLRFYLCGGAQVPPQLIHDAAAHFDRCAVSRIYGATEIPNVTGGINSRTQGIFGAETDGEVLGSEVRIVDPGDGGLLSPGETGEIVARGPQMFVGYTRREDNDDAFDEEGFFRLGDLGRLVDDRYILITGRKKDLIIRAGENISPKEVEDLLAGHPDIADIAIVAMPHPRTGEAACAFVIPQTGRVPSLPSIHDFLVEAGCAKQKIPERLELVSAFPRTSIGKIRKDLLRDRARELVEAEHLR
ncbi:hypothetical protein MB02_14445 [Croceicoccus estronivorus]|uniref:AMP-binding protein n=1 Tax=Croceicoccus estronivorus TaxID=1172626 RepID=UPI00082E0F2B|nr:AMP-binding protein [Croceicoccus estronivorus]OCC22960.1 hypothetical protein MB02_14445 [Croceicoccus estronivorus]